jgi:LacI family transcriptional regulator
MKKRITIKDVAERVGVTAATVSYVFNGSAQISDTVKEKVFAAAKELGYVPNLSARSLSSNNSKLIGVVIPQEEHESKLLLSNSFYSEIISVIEFESRKNGYDIILSGADINERFYGLIQKRSLDGLIVIGVYPDEFYEGIKNSNIPIVAIDSYFEHYSFHSIKINDEYGGYMATKYLIDKGHKKIAFAAGNIGKSDVVKNRYNGYLAALKEEGISINEKLIFQEHITYSGGAKIAEKFISQKTDATAIFCTADLMAIGMMNEFYKQGIKVPEDISIIGFDDIPISNYVMPGLTTVHQNIAQKGELAIRFIFETINNSSYAKQERTLPVEIVERNTVMQI